MVHFRLDNANVEQNNVKGDKRFFLPVTAKVQWDADARAVTIPVEYRPLRAEESRRHGKRNQQKNINEAAATAIPQRIGNAPDALAALTGERHSNANGPVSHLQYHLRRYTTRNNADFFIHKNLSGFLNRELDFYLKNEVLNLDHIANAGLNMAESWFQLMRLIKAVGSRIIDFLAQIEDFQKLLWEKRKFVTETQYCVTLGNIDADFHSDIITNDAQWNEWCELFNIDDTDRSEAFLQSCPTLVLDTRHFDTVFTNRLLASFDDLDGMTDGLLIHGENFQALNLMQARFHRQVQCVYIDPPYNAPNSEIIYKNNYKHSSFLSLIEARLNLSKRFNSNDGSHVVAIDKHEKNGVFYVLNGIFPSRNNVAVTVEHNRRGAQADHFSFTHEYALFSVPHERKTLNLMERPESEWKFSSFRNWGGESLRTDAANCFYPVFVQNNEIVGFGDVWADCDCHPSGPNVVREDGVVEIYPIDKHGVERKWRYERGTVEEIRSKLKVDCSNDGTLQVKIAKTTDQFKTVWYSPRYNAGDNGTRLVREMGLPIGEFDYPKSVFTTRDCVFAVSDVDALILDYFAGSGTTGHAVINLNREDGGERKFILVEMGEHFDTVLLPRIKKVTFTPEWKDGHPKRQATAEEVDRSPRIVKYIRLESYEDALDSIAFDRPGQLQLPGLASSDEYLLKYQLRWETRDSETLLNVAQLTDPFRYRLRVHVNGERRERKVDLPETFNYLLGLSVRTRRTHDRDGRRYLVYQGTTRAEPNRTVAVIWRATAGWTEDDFARDRDFIAAELLTGGADTVYVNGDSCIPGAKPVEPMFKARMFDGVGS